MADAATITRIGGLLKTTYGPAIVEQQNKIASFRKRYGKADPAARMGGDHFEFPARISGARGAVAPGASDDALPTATRQVEKKFLVYDRAYFGTIRVFDKDVENSKTNAQAFANHLTDEMTNMVQDIEKVINIDLVAGDGSGILSTISLGATSATQRFTIGTAFGQWGARYIQPGDVVDIYDSTLTTSRTSGTGVNVNSITSGTLTTGYSSVVLSASVTTTTGDIVVRGGGRVNKSYTGLYAATDSGTNVVTLQGLSRTTYPILGATVIAAGGVGIIESYLQNLRSKIEVASGQEPDEYMVGQAQWDAYEALGFAQKRFMASSMDKGYTSLSFGGKPFMKEVDTPPSVVYALCQEVIQFGELTPLGFMDADGDVLKWDQGYAAYKAVPREYGNMVYTRPNRLGRIEALNYGNAYAI